MIESDSSSRAMRRPAVSKAMPAAAYSGWYQPAPMPSSNRPPDSRCRLAAAVLGALLVLAALTVVPARLGARQPAAEVLRAEAA